MQPVRGVRRSPADLRRRRAVNRVRKARDRTVLWSLVQRNALEQQSEYQEREQTRRRVKGIKSKPRVSTPSKRRDSLDKTNVPVTLT